MTKEGTEDRRGEKKRGGKTIEGKYFRMKGDEDLGLTHDLMSRLDVSSARR